MELKRDGERYVVSPWALVFDDENYYMVAVEGSSLKHYRVDKMLRIKATGDPRAGREFYHEEEYGKKSLFGMYGGDIVPVTFQAKNWMIGIMIDRFGRDIPIAKVNDEEFETRADLAISPQFFGWLFALGPDIRVTSPGYVVNKLREYGENVMRNYQQP